MILKSFDFEKGVKLAHIRSNEMVENGLYSRFGLDRHKRLEKAFLGCLGEIAFEHYLKENKVDYKRDTTDFTSSNSDEFDFLCNGKKIDIKVAKKSTANNPTDYWTYGYPQEQNPISKDIVVVGWIDFQNKLIGFYGWISGKAISQYPVVQNNSYAGFRYLTPNHEFKWGVLNKNFSQLFSLL